MKFNTPDELIEYFNSLSSSEKAKNYLWYCKELLNFEIGGMLSKLAVATEASAHFGTTEIHADEKLNNIIMKADHSTRCLECWSDFTNEINN